mgnify:CR=1 FL=1
MRNRNRRNKPDFPLLLIIGLLGITLLLYAYKVFVYPFGILILLILLIARVMMLRSKRE